MAGDTFQRIDDTDAKPLSHTRSLVIQYRALPGLEKQRTNVVPGDLEPRFNYRSQFPLLMNPDSMDKLEHYTFIFEVWDQVSPAREDLIGLVRVPFQSFCISMKTTNNHVFSLNFMADQHCLYPMIIADGPLPIWSPKQGKVVGRLNATLALGSAIQVNRLISKEQ